MRINRWWVGGLAAVLLLMTTVGARAENLPPVELAYSVTVQSFHLVANGEEISVPLGRDGATDYTFAGSGSNTLEGVLTVRARGADRVSAQIFIDGAAPTVTRFAAGDLITFRTQAAVGPHRRVRVGYRVQAKPRVVTPTTDSPFDPDIGLTLDGAGQLQLIVDDAISTDHSVHQSNCSECLQRYFRQRTINKLMRWTGAKIATNLVDLVIASLGGGPLADLANQAWTARLGLAGLKNFIAEYIVKAIEGAIYNFFKALLTELIINGNFIMPDVPREVGKDFINAIIGTGFGEGSDPFLGELKGTISNFVVNKLGDEATDRLYRAMEADPHAQPTQEAERLAQELANAAAEAEEQLRARGLSSDYFRILQDDYTLTAGGRTCRFRVYGVHWLATGNGAILIICDPVPAGPERHGYLIRFNAGARRLRAVGSGGGMTEFEPTRGVVHDPDALMREVIGR